MKILQDLLKPLIWQVNTFAVYVSDYIDHDRAISMKAKQWIKDNLNIDIDLMQANIEITKKVKSF